MKDSGRQAAAAGAVATALWSLPVRPEPDSDRPRPEADFDRTGRASLWRAVFAGREAGG